MFLHLMQNLSDGINNLEFVIDSVFKVYEVL